MSENPFKLIRVTDEPPPHLRNEVLSSVKMSVLLMRFAQLFLADYTQTLFEKLSLLERKDGKGGGENEPEKRP